MLLKNLTKHRQQKRLKVFQILLEIMNKQTILKIFPIIRETNLQKRQRNVKEKVL